MKRLSPTIRRRTVTKKSIKKIRNFSGKGREPYILGFKAESQNGVAEGITNVHVHETHLDCGSRSWTEPNAFLA